jgi:VWFA-related protein
MTHSLLALSLALSLALLPLDSQQSDARNRTIFASVLDGGDKPVQGLTAEDFIVREDGRQREVLNAVPAAESLTISVLIDDSQAAEPAIPFIRDGLTAFVAELEGKAQIALATLGERPTSVVDYTTSAVELKKGITRIFARQGSGAYLLDAIVDVSRGLQKRESARPVIVALTVEGVEFSNRQYEAVLKEMERGRATLHVLAIGTPADLRTDEMRNRALVMSEGTSRTGGRNDQLLALSSIPQKLKDLAAELRNQYAVTYVRPEALIPPERLEVSVKRPGLTVRAPKRASGR